MSSQSEKMRPIWLDITKLNSLFARPNSNFQQMMRDYISTVSNVNAMKYLDVVIVNKLIIKEHVKHIGKRVARKSICLEDFKNFSRSQLSLLCLCSNVLQ